MVKRIKNNDFGIKNRDSRPPESDDFDIEMGEINPPNDLNDLNRPLFEKIAAAVATGLASKPDQYLMNASANQDVVTKFARDVVFISLRLVGEMDDADQIERTINELKNEKRR